MPLAQPVTCIKNPVGYKTQCERYGYDAQIIQISMNPWNVKPEAFDDLVSDSKSRGKQKNRMKQCGSHPFTLITTHMISQVIAAKIM